MAKTGENKTLTPNTVCTFTFLIHFDIQKGKNEPDVYSLKLMSPVKFMGFMSSWY